nr:cbb3-type cytochrome c oxidase subunit I [Sandarakinorhabdus sp.]
MPVTLVKSGALFAAMVVALLGMAFAADTPFAIHMGIMALAALLGALAVMAGADVTGKLKLDQGVYDDDPVRWGVIATTFWGVVGLFMGLFIASQLAWPVLNLDTEYTTFGRLRPLHTSAVIFAFGGNALIATSFYVVQRTCRARLAFPSLARFVFWGYQLFIVLAATGYVLGVTEGREYAEPEWYVD